MKSSNILFVVKITVSINGYFYALLCHTMLYYTILWLREWNKVRTWYFDKSPNLLTRRFPNPF